MPQHDAFWLLEEARRLGYLEGVPTVGVSLWRAQSAHFRHRAILRSVDGSRDFWDTLPADVAARLSRCVKELLERQEATWRQRQRQAENMNRLFHPDTARYWEASEAARLRDRRGSPPPELSRADQVWCLTRSRNLRAESVKLLSRSIHNIETSIYLGHATAEQRAAAIVAHRFSREERRLCAVGQRAR